MEMTGKMRRLNAERHIMLLFVSLVSERSYKNPVVLPGINASGRDYIAIQTNEAAIVKAKSIYGEDLQDIFLLVTPEARATADFLRGESHVAYLERRMVSQFPDLAGHFHYIPYGDNADDMDSNLLDIAAIADEIKKYAYASESASIMVHADMTGGMRHASMMMLSILELLRYDGLEIGDVFYTDLGKHRVYEATQIQRMFMLISGVDEFLRFGSVGALREYFRDKRQSIELGALLDAMESFSGMIKACYTGYIRAALTNLAEAMEEFASLAEKDLQEKLFDGLLETIYDHYGKLLSGEASDLDIIRWCVDNDFLQQAMTLCTEWLPGYMVDNKIAYTDSQLVQKQCAHEAENGNMNRKMNRDWKQLFIMQYKAPMIKSENINKPRTTAPLRAIRRELEKNSNSAALGQIAHDYPVLKDFLAEYEAVRPEYRACNMGYTSWGYFSNKFPIYARVMKCMYDERRKNPNYHSTFNDFFKKFNYNNMLAQLASNTEAALIKMFDLPQTESLTKMTIPTPQHDLIKLAPDEVEEAIASRYSDYCNMYESGILKTKLSSDAMLRCLVSYKSIQQLRNATNHAARQRAYIHIDDIRLQITRMLDLLESVR